MLESLLCATQVLCRKVESREVDTFHLSKSNPLIFFFFLYLLSSYWQFPSLLCCQSKAVFFWLSQFNLFIINRMLLKSYRQNYLPNWPYSKTCKIKQLQVYKTKQNNDIVLGHCPSTHVLGHALSKYITWTTHGMTSYNSH